MSIQRIHHSNVEQLDLSVVYNQTFYKKPLGLWYDINGGWKEFCKDNEFLDAGNNHFLLDVDTSKILIIDSAEKVIQFNNNFSYIPDKIQCLLDIERRIYWDKLSKIYSGLEIYLEREKYFTLDEYAWYRSWDIISGCIWDLSIIKSVTQITL